MRSGSSTWTPVIGAKAAQRRPAVVVSNDRVNAVAARLARGVVAVVPVTSNVTRMYPFQVLLVPGPTGLDVESKAQAEQVRSVSVERLGPALGRLPATAMSEPATAMSELDKALRLHLGL